VPAHFITQSLQRKRQPWSRENLVVERGWRRHYLPETPKEKSHCGWHKKDVEAPIQELVEDRKSTTPGNYGTNG